VPAGFTKEIYDRAVLRGESGGKTAGDLVGPKAVELPVAIDFLGRPFTEPQLIRMQPPMSERRGIAVRPRSFRDYQEGWRKLGNDL